MSYLRHLNLDPGCSDAILAVSLVALRLGIWFQARFLILISAGERPQNKPPKLDCPLHHLLAGPTVPKRSIFHCGWSHPTESPLLLHNSSASEWGFISVRPQVFAEGEVLSRCRAWKAQVNSCISDWKKARTLGMCSWCRRLIWNSSCMESCSFLLAFAGKQLQLCKEVLAQRFRHYSYVCYPSPSLGVCCPLVGLTQP